MREGERNDDRGEKQKMEKEYFCREKESKGIEFIGEVLLNFERILHYDINNMLL